MSKVYDLKFFRAKTTPKLGINQPLFDNKSNDSGLFKKMS